ncbi:transposase [Chryseobacterium sp. ES2]|uniref:Transposase n=1 Tax=Chryseobacterium metallicongregator TaxID=3073042 RepID=A0ABU1E7A3_9FLAO|nr:transposase [Chryseobacterium sp. ES2]MDR4953643.1 transposase [Chryseobacterium sp. ES2]
MIINHYRDIQNYFDQRSTNAAAESFNSKIKNFRIQLSGVKNRTSQTMYRLPFFSKVFLKFII